LSGLNNTGNLVFTQKFPRFIHVDIMRLIGVRRRPSASVGAVAAQPRALNGPNGLRARGAPNISLQTSSCARSRFGAALNLGSDASADCGAAAFLVLDSAAGLAAGPSAANGTRSSGICGRVAAPVFPKETGFPRGAVFARPEGCAVSAAARVSGRLKVCPAGLGAQTGETASARAAGSCGSSGPGGVPARLAGAVPVWEADCRAAFFFWAAAR
jgi:hypothetical protein